MSSWQCKKRFGDSFSSHGTLCAGSAPDGAAPGGDSCQGAAGAGLLCQEEAGRWVLAGILAGGHGCGDPSSATLYTRVGRFRAWIDEVVGTRGPGGDAGAGVDERWDRQEGRMDGDPQLHGEPEQAQTNDIIDFSDARRPHAKQHIGTHVRAIHRHQDAQTVV